MASFSQVNILGYIGNDVQLLAGKSRNFVQLSMGVTNSFRPKGAKNWKTKTRWIKVMFYGEYAEHAATRLSRGDHVFITGTLEISEWVKEGVKLYDMHVVGKSFVTVGHSKKSKAGGGKAEPEYETSDDEVIY